MGLAAMIHMDETSLICDFAETYHVLNYRALPLHLAAALACGLDENSRIRRKITGERFGVDTLLLAAAVDRLTTLAWMRTKDGEKNRNRPPSILARLTGNTEGTEQNDIQTFDTPEAFREAQEAIRKGG